MERMLKYCRDNRWVSGWSIVCGKLCNVCPLRFRCYTTNGPTFVLNEAEWGEMGKLGNIGDTQYLIDRNFIL